MSRINKDMKVGTKHTMNSGNVLEIVEYYNALKVRVVFPDTNYSVLATASSIRKGKVKNKLSADVFGVGVIGTEHNSSHPLYGSWIWYLRKHYNKGEIPEEFLNFSEYVKFKEKEQSMWDF